MKKLWSKESFVNRATSSRARHHSCSAMLIRVHTIKLTADQHGSSQCCMAFIRRSVIFHESSHQQPFLKLNLVDGIPSITSISSKAKTHLTPTQVTQAMQCPSPISRNAQIYDHYAHLAIYAVVICSAQRYQPSDA